MKNIILIVILCFIGVGLYAQQENNIPLKTEIMILKRLSEPSTIHVTATMSKDTLRRRRQNNTLTLVQSTIEKTNTQSNKLVAIAKLSAHKTLSIKKTDIHSQNIEVKLEQMSSPPNVKTIAIKAK